MHLPTHSCTHPPTLGAINVTSLCALPQHTSPPFPTTTHSPTHAPLPPPLLQGAIYVTSNGAMNWTAAVQETVDATLNRVISSGIR